MEIAMLLAVPTLGLLAVAFLGYRTLKATASLPRADVEAEPEPAREAPVQTVGGLLIRRPRPASVMIISPVMKHRPRPETRVAYKIHAAE